MAYAEDVTQVPACVTAATARFQVQDFVAAAELAENCWQSTRHPRAMFLLGMSRLSQQSYALALLALDRYLAADPRNEPPRSRLTAQMKRDDARKRAVAVTLKISPPLAQGVDVEIVAERGGDVEAPPLTVKTRELERGEFGPVLWLDPGPWTVKLTRAGYQPVQQDVELAPATSTHVLAITMNREAMTPALPPPNVDDEPAPGPTPRPRALILGEAVGGGVMIVGGIVALGVGSVRRASLAVCESPDGNYLDCKQRLAGSLRLRDAGGGLFGAGVGLLAGALTWVAPEPKLRRKLWIAEAAVGGAAITGGALWLTFASAAFNRANTGPVSDWPAHAAANNAGQHAVAATMFGLGAGLIAAATTGLLVERARNGRKRAALRTLRLDAAGGARRVGLSLSGAF